jgi:hypothetical protein
MAETEGFEPSIPLSRYAHLANECLQPLGHVSAPGKSRFPPEVGCMPDEALCFKHPVAYILRILLLQGNSMHTLIVIGAGLALLFAVLVAGRLVGKGGPAALYKAAMLFIPLWFIGAGVNMLVGIFKAGYSFSAEAPIFLVVFGLPALLAYALARFVFRK